MSRWLLLAYALSNVVLYSMLLPLWEGFDEPFHFGYAQSLANGGGFPDLRTARLSQEVGSSLLVAPASVSVQRNLPEVVSYPEFFSWPESRRREVRQKLNQIPETLRWAPSPQFLNYEAQQAPLAYMMLAVPERIMAGLPLPDRVMALRMIAGSMGVLLLIPGVRRVCAHLGMSEPCVSAALFCLLSVQMTWATLARISNDWLAVPLTVWVLATAMESGKRPAWRCAAVLSIGLLSKAYFLAFAPLPIALCVWRRRWKDLAITILILVGIAGPWYARNEIHYGSISGMQESARGADPAAGLRAIQVGELPRVILGCMRSALWTGNNTFRSFSGSTLAILLSVWFVALSLCALTWRGGAEWITAIHCGLFLVALIYYGSLSRAVPEPWYSQVLVIPLLILAVLGAGRAKRFGRITAGAMVLIFGYVLVCTYWIKLIPLYGGFEGRTSLAGTAHLYLNGWPTLRNGMNDLCLGQTGAIVTMSGIVTLLAVWLAVRVLWSLAPRQLGR